MIVSKEHMLNEIRRVANQIGATPGQTIFTRLTRIPLRAWCGRHWARWSDAIAEAGLQPTRWQPRFKPEAMLERYARFALELGHMPTHADMSIAKRCPVTGTRIPNWRTYKKHFGGREQLMVQLRAYCKNRPEFAALESMSGKFVDQIRRRDGTVPTTRFRGYVYLMQSGRYYKIGSSGCLSRRHREVAVQMPDRLMLLHEIRTDDPSGIEQYWHRRFAEKRLNGEWFDLDAEDVRAFRRRRGM